MDWVQVLFVGLSAGIGVWAASGVRGLISSVERRAYRVLLILLALVLFAAVGVLLRIVFPENPRIVAVSSAFVTSAAIGLVVFGPKSFRHKRNASRSEPGVQPRDHLKTSLSGFGCFEVDIDPRTMQPARNRNLYFFLDGNLGVSDTHLIFTHQHLVRGDAFRRETAFRDITAIRWRPYDTINHEGEENARYLTRGIWRPWMEIGYFWLPGGKETEMECIIHGYDGSEGYFYFRNTAENMKRIQDIHKQVTAR